MSKLPIIISLVVVTVLLFNSTSLIGCSSAATATTTASGTGQITPTSSTGQQTPNQSGQPRHGGQDISAVLAKVATILGISTQQVTAAFEQAQTSFWGGQKPPQGQGGQPPAGGTPPNMTALFDKMAEILNIPSATIAKAFEQAQQ